MKSKTKALLAVMAVAVMLGCALVPLTVANGDAQATDADAKEFDEVDYLEIINVLREGMTELDVFELEGITLVPVEKNEGEGILIEGTHDAPYGCIAGESYTLGDNTFNNNGKIIVNPGATLQLFPLDHDQKFKLTDNYSKSGGWDKLVLLKTDSFLEIFGMRFLVINTADDDNGFVMFGMVKNYESAVDCSFNYSNKSAEDKMTLTAKLTTDSVGGEAVIANISFTPDDKGNCLDVSGTMAPVGDYGMSFTDGKIKFQSEFDKEVTIRGYEGELTGNIGGTIAVEKLLITYDVDSEGDIDGHFEADMSIENGKDPWIAMTLYVPAEISGMPLDVTVKLNSKKTSLSTGDVGFEITGNKNLDISVVASEDVKMHMDDIYIEIALEYMFIPINLQIFTKNVNVSLNEEFLSVVLASSQDDYDVTKVHMTGGVAVSFESLLIKRIDPLTTQEYTHASIGDFRLNASSITVDKDDKSSSVSIGEMTIETGTVTGYFISYYDGTFNAKITDFNLLSQKGSKAITFNGSVEFNIIYDGDERAIDMELDNANIVRSSKGTTVLADRVELYKDVPNDVFEGSLVIIPAINQYGIPDYMEIEAKKVDKQADKDYTMMEYASVRLENIDIYNELGVEFIDGVKISFTNQPENESNATTIVKAQCGEIKGSFSNFGILTQKFSITDNPEVQYIKESIGRETLMSQLRIDKGDAVFNEGIFDIDLVIGKEAKFSAKGASFSGLTFEKGSQVSGTVTLMSFEWGMADPFDDSRNQFNSEIVCMDDEVVVCVLTMKSRGFTIGMDLSDLKSGTVDARRGYTLPENYRSSSEKGEYEITSDNGKTGKITIFTDITIVDCDKDIPRDSFILRYQDDFVEEQTYNFGDIVKITDKEPTKDGMKFRGWTDGSRSARNLILKGSEYIMPARDVTLKPVFMKDVVPDVIFENDKAVLIVDAKDANVANITNIPDKWDMMRVMVDNVTVEFDKKTFDRMEYNQSVKTQLCVSVTLIDGFNDEFIDDAIGNKKIYSIELAPSSDGGVLEYSGDTVFKVTVNMKLDDTVNKFNVSSFDMDYGYLSNVGLDEYKRCGDGSYDVTFTVNHFSLYAIEPVYKNTLDNLFILVILIIAIILMCAIVARFVDRNKTPE